jgi:hypothetical protein
LNNKLKPIRLFGILLIVLTILGAFFIGTNFFLNKSSSFYIFGPTSQWSGALFFMSGLLIYYLITGFGVILVTKWGYYTLKILLYAFFVAFPIGTFISYIMLSYMKKNDIRKLFGIGTAGGADLS